MLEDKPTSGSTDRSEVWSLFLTLCLFLLLGEAFLGQPTAVLKKKNDSINA
jgi:hypothetical protein